MKVYVITKGTYSDYHIVGVSLDPEVTGEVFGVANPSRIGRTLNKRGVLTVRMRPRCVIAGAILIQADLNLRSAVMRDGEDNGE